MQKQQTPGKENCINILAIFHGKDKFVKNEKETLFVSLFNQTGQVERTILKSTDGPVLFLESGNLKEILFSKFAYISRAYYTLMKL